MSERRPIRTPGAASPKMVPPKKAEKKDVTAIIAAVLAIQIILAIVFGVVLFRRGYQNAKNETVDKIRKEAYDTVYGQTENAYHVSNSVEISLSGIREKADLEVLQVEASYLYITDEEDKERGQTIWFRIPGTGSFTVDMRMAEFIIDNERRYVLVRLPEPAITVFNEDYEHIEKLLFKDGWISNGSIKEGEEIARKMLTQAHVRMLKRFEMTQAYYSAAKDSAVRLVTNAIKALNPGIPGITVEVVFNESTKRSGGV